MKAMNEIKIVTAFMNDYPFDEAARSRIKERARRWMQVSHEDDMVTDLLQGFDLSSREGLALMELAEAYLRIPDARTRRALLRDKLNAAGWDPSEANNTIAAFMGRFLKMGKTIVNSPLSSAASPFMHFGARGVMSRMAQHFVMGETIEQAIENAQKNVREREKYSFDMLGEGARTYEDADRYFQAYKHAITAAKGVGNISIKLSALHPKFEETHRRICFDDMVHKLTQLCLIAKRHDIEVRVDAEEERRLDLMLDIIEAVSAKEELKNWNGFGLAVQAYLKRTPQTIERLQQMAQNHDRIIGVRLVKGAYWDSEIKYAQMMGHKEFPVFTRKVHTDLSYIHCAQKLLHASHIYPAFGSHNAMTLSAVAELAGEDKNAFETQRLVGMGDAIHEAMRAEGYTIGVYAPVGSHTDLLPYLVRRLLENGANSSFVKMAAQGDDTSLADPYETVHKNGVNAHSKIRDAKYLYNNRENSLAPVLGHRETLNKLCDSVATISVITNATETHSDEVNHLFDTAQRSFKKWKNTDAETRAGCLEKLAELLTENRDKILYLLQNEARKTLSDAIGEWRETIDFCRYYAQQTRAQFTPQILPSADGEKNIYTREGRGVFVCIAPWNFPLAIFLGQVTAALAAGNCVIAKPAEQTPQIGAFAIDLAHKAGFPKDVLQIALGDGRLGAVLTQHPQCGGVAFTGSYEVGKIIQRTLATKDGAMVPLIAETAGLNAMAVDSSALPEQVIDDVILSAFGSAGQRCSALRVLLLQEEAADRVLNLLKGAMATLTLGDSFDTATDVPPLIDAEAAQTVREAIETLKRTGKVIHECPHSDVSDLVPPIAIDMTGQDFPSAEIFGPVLQVYRVKDLKTAVESINKQGFALAFGIHTRLSSVEKELSEVIEAGNIYINRSIIGAVVGVQPFGGHGKSGTGPKAGGPQTLLSYCVEGHISVNTTAAGGNVSLVALQE